MSRHAFAALTLAVVLVLSRDAGADENPCPDPGCHIKNPSTLTTTRGNVLKLPPGYFIDEPTFGRRDAELKTAQNQVTRLKAENESFRKDAARFSWAPVVGSVISLVGGVVLYSLVK